MKSKIMLSLALVALMVAFMGPASAAYSETYNTSDILPIVVDTGLMGVIEVQPHIPDFVSILVLVWMFTLLSMAATAAVGVVYIARKGRKSKV